MENKYYVPEIEDFHVGFEYEINNNPWELKKVSVSMDLEAIQYHIKNGDIRVKYLNQDDIESLGFTDKATTVLDWYTSEKRSEDNWASYGYWNNFRLLHDREKNKVKIIAYEYGWEEENVLFQGDCKNKSELIKILNQVGYGK